MAMERNVAFQGKPTDLAEITSAQQLLNRAAEVAGLASMVREAAVEKLASVSFPPPPAKETIKSCTEAAEPMPPLFNALRSELGAIEYHLNEILDAIQRTGL